MAKALVVATLFAGSSIGASADSFCGYEAGLIGTKGIGYVSPHSAAASDADYDYDTKICRVPVYASPEAAQHRMVDCLEIDAFPTEYHSDEAYVSGLLENGFPVTFSDYYAFTVFDWAPPFARVKLHSGQSAWIKSKHGLYGNVYHPDRAVGLYGQTTSELFFHRADHSAFAPPPDIEGPVAEAFLKLLFEDLGVPLEVPQDMWDWFITSARHDYYYGFTYNVTAIEEDEAGGLWYVASEHLTIDALASGKRHQELETLLNGPKHGPYSSPVIRTVYIPFRDADGIVQSVFLPGPYCD